MSEENNAKPAQKTCDTLIQNYLLACSLHLSKKMFAPWPRRGHSFLQIRPAHWKELELLWESGFEVSAISFQDNILENAPAHLQTAVDVHKLRPKALEHLPFSQKTFDYVGINLLPDLLFDTPLQTCNNAESHQKKSPHVLEYEQSQTEIFALPLHSILSEALRVTTKGIIFQGLNPFSIMGLQRKCFLKSLPAFCRHGSWYAWRDICNTLRTIEPLSDISTASMLLGSGGTWKTNSFLHKFNESIFRLPIGALMQIRLNITEYLPLTGTVLRISKSLQRNKMEHFAERSKSIKHNNT